MSPLLFLAIAIVVPIIGMIVLGIGARIKNQRVKDDETKPFRRHLDSLAPQSDGSSDSPADGPGASTALGGSVDPGLRSAATDGTPGSAGGPTADLHGGASGGPAGAQIGSAAGSLDASSAVPVGLAFGSLGESSAAPVGPVGAASSPGEATSAAASSNASTQPRRPRDRGRRRDRRESRRRQPDPPPANPTQHQHSPASVRLIEREYSVPLLPPMSAEFPDYVDARNANRFEVEDGPENRLDGRFDGQSTLPSATSKPLAGSTHPWRPESHSVLAEQIEPWPSGSGLSDGRQTQQQSQLRREQAAESEISSRSRRGRRSEPRPFVWSSRHDRVTPRNQRRRPGS